MRGMVRPKIILAVWKRCDGLSMNINPPAKIGLCLRKTVLYLIAMSLGLGGKFVRFSLVSRRFLPQLDTALVKLYGGIFFCADLLQKVCRFLSFLIANHVKQRPHATHLAGGHIRHCGVLERHRWPTLQFQSSRP